LKNKRLYRTLLFNSSKTNIRNLNIWSLGILKNSKNKNLNKCIFKGKNLVNIFSPKYQVNFVFYYGAPQKTDPWVFGVAG